MGRCAFRCRDDSMRFIDKIHIKYLGLHKDGRYMPGLLGCNRCFIECLRTPVERYNAETANLTETRPRACWIQIASTQTCLQNRLWLRPKMTIQQLWNRPVSSKPNYTMRNTLYFSIEMVRSKGKCFQRRKRVYRMFSALPCSQTCSPQSPRQPCHKRSKNDT